MCGFEAQRMSCWRSRMRRAVNGNGAAAARPLPAARPRPCAPAPRTQCCAVAPPALLLTVAAADAPRSDRVKALTLPRLVARLTASGTTDFRLRDAFVLCYRSFCNATELAMLLEQRYLSAEEVAELEVKKLQESRQAAAGDAAQGNGAPPAQPVPVPPAATSSTPASGAATAGSACSSVPSQAHPPIRSHRQSSGFPASLAEFSVMSSSELDAAEEGDAAPAAVATTARPAAASVVSTTTHSTSAPANTATPARVPRRGNPPVPDERVQVCQRIQLKTLGLLKLWLASPTGHVEVAATPQAAAVVLRLIDGAVHGSRFITLEQQLRVSCCAAACRAPAAAYGCCCCR